MTIETEIGQIFENEKPNMNNEILKLCNVKLTLDKENRNGTRETDIGQWEIYTSQWKTNIRKCKIGLKMET